MNKKVKSSKITILNNCFYILKQVIMEKPFYYLFYIVAYSILNAIDSVLVIIIFKSILDVVVQKGPFLEVIRILLIYGIGLGGFTTICSIVLLRYNEIVTLKINGIILNKIMRKAAELDIACYDNSEFYDGFVRAVERGKNEITNSILVIVNFTSGLVSIISIAAVMMSINKVLAIMPCIACILNLCFQTKLNKVNLQMNLELDIINRKKNYASKVFYQPQYAKEMRMTKVKEIMVDIFNQSIKEEKKVCKKYGTQIFVLEILNYILSWTMLVYYLPLLYMIYKTVVQKKMTISQLTSMNEANTTMVNSLNSLVSYFLEFQKISLFGEYYRNFMEFPINIEKKSGDEIDSSCPHHFLIQHLYFRFDKDSPYILEDINMIIRPGEKIAIVGRNGAGKSTLIKLLLRLYENTEGTILYNSKEIKTYDIKKYRDIFGVIVQEFQLYAASVAENVIMNEISENSKQKIFNALDIVGMNEKIKSLKYQYQTEVTREFNSEGSLFSGGEAQKIAFSRIFTNNYQVAILDEPSSALDPISEYELNKNMFEAAKDKTVIYISHRLSTTKMADRIYFLDKGKIIEEGNHQELMERDGEYAKLFHIQGTYYQ